MTDTAAQPSTPPPPAGRTTPSPPTDRERARSHNALREIRTGSAAKQSEPTIVERDDIREERSAGAFCGRIYFVWMAHSDDGGCDRDPVTDPHEDLAYLGKTIRELFVRWIEHLTGNPKPSAVTRRRERVTGFSADPRRYRTADKLAAAELAGIKALWPAWNIADTDRRNPHTRATRAYRRPDRLAPLIGLASALWALVWAAITAGLVWVTFEADAAWYWTALAPLVALWMVLTAFGRHRGAMARRSRRRGMKNNKRRQR